MEINIPNFEMQNIEIRETYVDDTGRIQERIKTVSVPTGRIKEGEEKTGEEK